MLTPYILHSAVPPSAESSDHEWAVPIYKLCATTHTAPIRADSPSMTPSEGLILQAVQETSREICRVATNMWVSGVLAGLDPQLNRKESPDFGQANDLMDGWKYEVSRLMGWLDWSVWVKCKPACGPEEMCYLPTWPVGFPRPKWDPERPRPGSHNSTPGTWSGPHVDFRTSVIESMAVLAEEGRAVKPEPDEWMRPQPKCIRRVEPYDF
ncbi:hypothetical protein HYDPIDRAFT_44772 [Hydnomerulius pinastri MD-312]|uniref:Uncharacterized protein n=1 Tax=Hydnomerulius pinastri MD-312 TaxID=994086 RepID=A0A0C9W5F8_9AGAM|nr:hypothetical protein HYDPIDRAFT_44772 [Hydnomerulius pinastri MD-312]